MGSIKGHTRELGIASSVFLSPGTGEEDGRHKQPRKSTASQAHVQAAVHLSNVYPEQLRADTALGV